jgi:hypothetical protein
LGLSFGYYNLYVLVLKGLALPRASHSGEITLAGSRRWLQRLYFSHNTVVTAAKKYIFPPATLKDLCSRVVLTESP